MGGNIVSFLLSALSSFQISPQYLIHNSHPYPHLNPHQNSYSSFKFTNHTGSGSPAQFKCFIDIINNATSIYQDHIQKTLGYIEQSMFAKYGESDNRYSAILQLNISSRISYYLWAANNDFASVSPGVDRQFPERTYMFVANFDEHLQRD